MTPHQIRAALSRPPVFGDTEQIAALRALRQEDEAHEGKTEYRVTIDVSFSETVTVWAEDEDEARELAKDEMDIDDADIEYHVRKV